MLRDRGSTRPSNPAADHARHRRGSLAVQPRSPLRQAKPLRGMSATGGKLTLLKLRAIGWGPILSLDILAQQTKCETRTGPHGNCNREVTDHGQNHRCEEQRSITCT